MPADEPCLLYATEDLFDLPAPALSAATSAWPDSDSEDEGDSQPAASGSFARFDWSSCLSDDVGHGEHHDNKPRSRRPDWVSARSKRIVGIVAGGSTLAVASQDGTLTLFRPPKTGETPRKKPEMGRRKGSDRSITSPTAILSPGSSGRTRKASATVSVTDVDASAPMRHVRSSKGGSAADALGAVSPHGPELPSTRRSSISIHSHAAHSTDNVAETSSIFSLPTSPDHSQPPAIHVDFVAGRMEPFVQTAVTDGLNTIVDLALGERSDVCLVLTSDGHLDRISLLDGALLGSVRLDAGDAPGSPRPVKLCTRQIGTAQHAFVFTDTSIVFCVCIDTHQLVSRLTLPHEPSSTALVESEQGDLLVAIVYGEAKFVQLLPLLTIPQVGHKSPCTFALATPRQPLSANLESRDILDLASYGKILLACTNDGLDLLTVDEQQILVIRQVALPGARDVLAYSSSCAIIRCSDGSVKITSLINDELKPNNLEIKGRLELATFTSAAEVCSAVAGEEGRRVSAMRIEDSLKCKNVRDVFASSDRKALPTISQVMAIGDKHLIGSSTGHVILADVERMSYKTSTWTLSAAVSCFAVLPTKEGKTRYAVGSVSGEVVTFDEQLELLQSWTVCTSPVVQMTLLDHANVGHLNGSLVLMSANCTTAFVPLDNPTASILSLPGSKTPLREVRVRHDEIRTSFMSGMWRQWDAQTGELRRSVQEPLGPLSSQEASQWWTQSPKSGQTGSGLSGPQLAIPLDLRALLKLSELPPTLKKVEAAFPHRLALLKTLLDDILPQHANSSIDALVEKTLRSRKERSDHFVLHRHQRPLRVRRKKPVDALLVSGRVSVTRMLPALAILKLLCNFGDCEHAAQSAADALVGLLRLDRSSTRSLADALAVLATHWTDASSELQSSSRGVIESTISRLDDDAAIAQATHWHAQVFDRDESLPQADRGVATLLLALVAIQHFDCLEPGLLLATAHCIVESLAAESPKTRVLATELFGRGFQLWHNQLDILPSVNKLIDVAFAEPEGDKDPAADRDQRQASRTALLAVVAHDMPLLMTSLNLEQLHTVSTRQRIANMRLIAFVIRKKPMLMLPSLPRLVDMTVKALDPLSRTARNAIQPTASYLLQELVKTYPTVAFAESTQRLAVGAHDGGVLMYDVKTATRLYVLASHQHPVTAVDLSPDGRRLVSLSLDESRVAVWKIGASLLGMLNAGGPPRQGPQGSTAPYKTYDFAHGEGDVQMTTASTLHLVAWDWPGDRTARLRIRETSMTFSCA